MFCTTHLYQCFIEIKCVEPSKRILWLFIMDNWKGISLVYPFLGLPTQMVPCVFKNIFFCCSDMILFCKFVTLLLPYFTVHYFGDISCFVFFTMWSFQFASSTLPLYRAGCKMPGGGVLDFGLDGGVPPGPRDSNPCLE